MHLQHILIAAALNLIRLGAWLSGVPHAQTRQSRFMDLKPKTV
jgi:transposase